MIVGGVNEGGEWSRIKGCRWEREENERKLYVACASWFVSNNEQERGMKQGIEDDRERIKNGEG
jgi:hypothetical protein